MKYLNKLSKPIKMYFIYALSYAFFVQYFSMSAKTCLYLFICFWDVIFSSWARLFDVNIFCTLDLWKKDFLSSCDFVAVLRSPIKKTTFSHPSTWNLLLTIFIAKNWKSNNNRRQKGTHKYIKLWEKIFTLIFSDKNILSRQQIKVKNEKEEKGAPNKIVPSVFHKYVKNG